MNTNPGISTLLKGNPYPGRGIAVGLGADGRAATFAYFIMGRSANSRNRVLCRVGDSLFTKPYDESKVEDPSLIIYRAARWTDGGVIVTNGDQTDTVYEGAKRGIGIADALRTRTYEPDAPNYTPRISAMLRSADGAFDYSMSILRRDETGDCERAFYDYAACAGVGHLVHTYQTDGNPLPSFVGAPRTFAMPDGARALADEIWQALDENNKIALYVACIDLSDGSVDDVLYNKYE